MSFEICSHSRQLVGCQMPNFFSRIAGLSPRVSTASRKLFAIVSATVSTAGLAMPFPPCHVPPIVPACAGLFVQADRYLAPSFLLFPAPFTAGTGFLGAKVKLLDILGMHQTVASVVHHNAADLEHIAVMRSFQRDLGILLDQQDRHPLLVIDASNDLEDFLDQERRQAERRLIQKEERRPVHQRAADRKHLLFAAGKLAGGLIEPFLEPRKVAVDTIEILGDAVAIVPR